MILGSCRLTECNTEMQLLHGGTYEEKLETLVDKSLAKKKYTGLLKGFFFKTRKTVSRSSTYLVR